MQLFFLNSFYVEITNHLLICTAQNHNHIATVGFTICTVNSILFPKKICHVEKETYYHSQHPLDSNTSALG